MTSWFRVPRGKNKQKKLLITGEKPTKLVVHCTQSMHAYKVLQTDTDTMENARERERETERERERSKSEWKVLGKKWCR